MATTTPNFGWPVPTSTDLVKDGATAMEALGDAIDTSMVDLKGGTTGQILSKATNADMDFTWIANDQGDITGVTAGTGISGGGTSGTVTVTNSMATTITTKGDLVPGTGSGTFARLAAGSNGETLVADSSTSTGLRYQGDYAAGKNKIINGDMGIWQRGTSFAVGNTGPYYGAADRWRYYHNGATAGTNTVSRQAFTVGQTDVPNNPTYFQRWTATTVAGSQTVCDFDQLIEDVSTFAGQTVNASIYLKSSGTFTYTVFLEQNFGSGGSGSVATTIATGSTTTGWVRVTGSATLPSISGKTVGTGSSLRFLVRFSSPTSGATFDISNAKVEAGSVATAFQTATGTIQGELAACQRYYWRSNIGSNTNAGIGWGFTYSATAAYMLVKLPISMRVPPTSIEFAALSLENWGGTVYTCSNVTLSQANVDMIRVQTTNSGMTGQQYANMFLTSGTTYLAASAEL